MIPDREGVWLNKRLNLELDVYELEPVGCLCVWGDDYGMVYTSAKETQGCWTDDEFQGHVPVHIMDNDENSWEFVRPFNLSGQEA